MPARSIKKAGTPAPEAAVLTPPLKWAGGKRWQVPHLEPLWRPHAHRRLVEPFVGGLAVALGLSPTKAILNDINPHLISFYEWLRRGLKVTIPLENDETLFYEHRKRFNALLAAGQGTGKEAASLFYFLNRTGYNGLCRFNRSGQFNVPFGSYKKITYTRDFTPYRAAFGEWNFQVGDFEAIRLEKTDFVYADPPYDVDFTHYSQGGFSWDDQVRAAKWLAKHRGPVILVNQATTRVAAANGAGAEELLLAAPGDRMPWVFVKTPFSESSGTFSPDGRWVAYTSTRRWRSFPRGSSPPEGAGNTTWPATVASSSTRCWTRRRRRSRC